MDDAAREWLEARAAVLSETGQADVRTNDDFRRALERLANAEAALAEAVRAERPASPSQG